MNVLILGASNAIAIAIARIVCDAGHTAVMADSEKYSRAFFSRYCMIKYLVRDPLKDRAGFAADLSRCIQEGEIGLIVPTTDEALLNLVESKEVIPGNVMVTFPLHADKIRYVFDKANLPELCKKAGVKTPATLRVDKGFKVNKADGFNAPFALKRATGVAGEGFRKVEERGALEQALATSKKEFPESDFLIQEYISGSVFGAGGVFDGEKTEHFYSYRFIRRYPCLCGSPTVCQQEDLDSIKMAMDRILSVLQWKGYCQMDFIVDEKNGQPYLVDINPVHWYTMPFSLSDNLSCISYYLKKDKFQPIMKSGSAGNYTTLSLTRELQRILLCGIFEEHCSGVEKGYWCNFRGLKCSDFCWDPLPILLAPIMKLLRLGK